MPGPRRIRSFDAAVAFVERVGIAAVYPAADLVLPSLWEAVAGRRELEWALRDEDGKFVSFTPEMDRVWRWKDELPERRRACAGKHVTRVVTLISPPLVGAVYARTGRPGRPDYFRDLDELTSLQRQIAEAVRDNGPCTGREIRQLLGTSDKKAVDAAIWRLQRLLVLTNAGSAEQEHGWKALLFDLFARRWRAHLRRLPSPEEANATLAETVLRAAGDLSAADLAAALSWRRREAAAVLEALTERGLARVAEEDGIAIWRPARVAAACRR